MSERPWQSGPHGCGWVVLFLAMVLAIYALSIGPAAVWTATAPHMAPRAPGAAWRLYAPIDWLRERSETADRIVDWYLDLWD